MLQKVIELCSLLCFWHLTGSAFFENKLFLFSFQMILMLVSRAGNAESYSENSSALLF